MCACGVHECSICVDSRWRSKLLGSVLDLVVVLVFAGQRTLVLMARVLSLSPSPSLSLSLGPGRLACSPDCAVEAHQGPTEPIVQRNQETVKGANKAPYSDGLLMGSHSGS
jgi:hypothetical protein